MGTQKQPTRLTGDKLATFMAELWDNSLPDDSLGTYNIRGYTVTVKKRTKKYYTPKK